jgi:hypothetical protein
MRIRFGTAVLAAVLLALGGCSSSTLGGSATGGSASGGARPPTSLNGITAPAATGGFCIIGPHAIANLGGLVTGTLNWECHGSVLMQLNVRLIYLGNNAEHEAEVDEGQAISVDNITSPNPSRLSAPCTAGLWKMKIVGAITGTGPAPLTVNTSDKVNPPFNEPQWQNPISITC